VRLNQRAVKNYQKLPQQIQERFKALALELRASGPVQRQWPHFGKIQGLVNCYHCHIKQGRPTYVAVWKVTGAHCLEGPMLEPTKEQITKDFADVCRRYRLPDDKITKIQEAVSAILGAEDESLPLEEVFPDLHQGSAIRGLRLRGGLTQEQLARLLGIKRTNLSEMENGKRPIGKNMAKRLAQVLKTDYKVFL
jgi:DNA-binding XRE family transcriptional regulator